MLTLSELKKAAQNKKAETTVVQKVNAVKEIVAGVFPASNNALNERTVDILTVVAGLEQRVEYVEEVVGVTTEVNEEKAVVRAQGLFAQMKARREAKEAAEKEKKKQEKEAGKVAKKEETAPIPKAQPEAPEVKPEEEKEKFEQEEKVTAATDNKKKRKKLGQRVGIRFDAIPKMERE